MIGENGAGKSTLMKIIYGMVRPDAGDMLWEGREATVARRQTRSGSASAWCSSTSRLFETLTVAQNIALAIAGRRASRRCRSGSRRSRSATGCRSEPDRPVYSMSVGERQRVEIIRSLLQNPGLLIMDEPTSVLTPQAVQKLFVTLRQLATEGCSILYISHKLDEIRDAVRARDRAARRQGDGHGRSAPRDNGQPWRG